MGWLANAINQQLLGKISRREFTQLARQSLGQHEKIKCSVFNFFLYVQFMGLQKLECFMWSPQVNCVLTNVVDTYLVVAALTLIIKKTLFMFSSNFFSNINFLLSNKNQVFFICLVLTKNIVDSPIWIRTF